MITDNREVRLIISLYEASILHNQFLARNDIIGRPDDLVISDVLFFLCSSITGYRDGKHPSWGWMLRNIDIDLLLDYSTEIEIFIAAILDNTLFNWRVVNSNAIKIQHMELTSVELLISHGEPMFYYPLIPEKYTSHHTRPVHGASYANLIFNYDLIVQSVTSESLEIIYQSGLDLCTLMGDAMRVCQLSNISDIDHDFVFSQYDSSRFKKSMSINPPSESDDPMFDKLVMQMESLYIDAVHCLSISMYQTLRDAYQWLISTIVHSPDGLRGSMYEFESYSIQGPTLYMRVLI